MSDTLSTRPEKDRVVWARDVVAVLDSLTILQAESLRLMYFHGLPERGVAAQLSVSVHVVRSAAAEGLLRLGEIMLIVPRPA